MNKATDYPMTFRFALSVLEVEFDAIYRGLCQPDHVSDDERGDTFHLFETNRGPDRVVNDKHIFQLANKYA